MKKIPVLQDVDVAAQELLLLLASVVQVPALQTGQAVQLKKADARNNINSYKQGKV
jgi:hypothetical protein